MLGLALAIERLLLVGVLDVMPLGGAEAPRVELALGEPAHHAAVGLIGDHGLGGKPAAIGDAHEQREAEAHQPSAESDPADDLGDHRDRVPRIHEENATGQRETAQTDAADAPGEPTARSA